MERGRLAASGGGNRGGYFLLRRELGSSVLKCQWGMKRQCSTAYLN